MAEVGGLNVRITADDSSLQGGLKRSDKSLKGFSGNAAKYAASAAAAIATVGAAATAATFAITKASAESNRELVNQANLANSTASEFKAYSLAAKNVGIEQDKLADILKDVNDKVGDFLTTGAGGMVDFFEQVAPKVGVTADQFRNLSGPQALQLYVDTLQKANLSQAEMTFHLEAIASDSTALLPLLRNNGEALKLMTDNAREMGLVLSELEIQQLANATATFDRFGQVVDVATDRFALQFAPILDVIGERFSDLSRETNGFEGVVLSVADNVIGAVGFMADAWRGLEVVFNLLKVGALGFASGALMVLQSVSEGIDTVVNTGIEGINALIGAANKIPGVDIEQFVTGESGATASIRSMGESVNSALQDAINQFNETLDQPMPSEAFDRFIEDVRAKSEESARVAKDARLKALGLDDESVEQDGERMKSRFEILQQIEKQGQGGLTDAMRQAQDRREKKDKEEFDAKLGIAKKGFGSLANLQSSENKKLFEIGKAAAIANATISGYESVVHSYKEGTKLGGPIAGAAFATAAGVATAAQIAQIAGSSYGGGGGGAAAAAPAPQVPQTAQQEQSQDQFINVSLVGSENSQVSISSVKDLFEQINDGLSSGLRISGVRVT
ncbi:MAG: hypothetical protein R3204_03325 [Oceanospirillum sp.]|nr:hypothetical protein [Oceanospirillum sp.]